MYNDNEMIFSDPTPKRSSDLQNIDWPVANSTDCEISLIIDKDLSLKKWPTEQWNFWTNLYEDYAPKPLSTF